MPSEPSFCSDVKEGAFDVSPADDSAGAAELVSPSDVDSASLASLVAPLFDGSVGATEVEESLVALSDVAGASLDTVLSGESGSVGASDGVTVPSLCSGVSAGAVDVSLVSLDAILSDGVTGATEADDSFGAVLSDVVGASLWPVVSPSDGATGAGATDGATVESASELSGVSAGATDAELWAAKIELTMLLFIETATLACDSATTTAEDACLK